MPNKTIQYALYTIHINITNPKLSYTFEALQHKIKRLHTRKQILFARTRITTVVTFASNAYAHILAVRHAYWLELPNNTSWDLSYTGPDSFLDTSSLQIDSHWIFSNFYNHVQARLNREQNYEFNGPSAIHVRTIIVTTYFIQHSVKWFCHMRMK